MNKKGFTLVEIIICIALIIGIGIGSVFGVKQIKRNFIVDELSKITDKILAAVEVYIETDEKTHDQLYNKKNVAVIPLKTLINEGLVDLRLTTLEENDIENEYILSVLSTSEPHTNECIDVTNTPSWTMNSSTTIYLCGSSSAKSQTTIFTERANYNKVTSERYLFKGINPDNYVKYETYNFKLISVEKDDSLILASKDSFGTLFTGVTESVDYKERNASDFFRNPGNNGCSYASCLELHGTLNVATNSEALLSGQDILDTSDITRSYDSGYTSLPEYHFNSYLCDLMGLGSCSANQHVGAGRPVRYNETQGYKIHLKNCVKIISGSGTQASPFIIDNNCF